MGVEGEGPSVLDGFPSRGTDATVRAKRREVAMPATATAKGGRSAGRAPWGAALPPALPADALAANGAGPADTPLRAIPPRQGWWAHAASSRRTG